ncbi:MAG: rbsK [Nitrospira sp.]|nr:rbsK [Nitrospira sp.]
MIIVIGSSNIDLTVTVDCFPTPGETIPGHHFSQSFGGKGANQAVAAVRAGGQVVFMSKVGTDANGTLIEQYLSAQGFRQLAMLHHEDSSTGVAMILVDRAGDNQIVVVPGSNGRFTPDDIRQHATLMTGARVLLVQLEIPMDTVQEALMLAKRLGLITILNPAPARSLPPDLLRLVDILTPNESEARALTNLADAANAAQSLSAQGVGAVVVTCGERGAVMSRGKAVTIVPAFLVDAVDSTGAGDAFNGALASAVADGMELDSAIDIANAAGGLATTVRGVQESMPTKVAIASLLRHGTRKTPLA